LYEYYEYLVAYTDTRIKGIKVYYVFGGKEVVMEHSSVVAKKGEVLKEKVLEMKGGDYMTEAYCSLV
jgi:hypothetical protein